MKNDTLKIELSDVDTLVAVYDNDTDSLYMKLDSDDGYGCEDVICYVSTARPDLDRYGIINMSTVIMRQIRDWLGEVYNEYGK